MSFLLDMSERSDSGITLKLFGGAYRLVTKTEFADDIKRLLENPSPQSITKASLEVLAIIAYKQPVTRVEIDDLRGVKSEGPITYTYFKRAYYGERAFRRKRAELYCMEQQNCSLIVSD